MTTDPTAAAAVLPIGSALQTIPISNTESEQFVLLRAPAMPEFCFLIRADAEPRFSWEAWLTIRQNEAEQASPRSRLRIASFTWDLDALPLTTSAPAIATTCRHTDVAVLFVQNARRSTLWGDGLVIPGIHVVDLDEYSLALLSRYGLETISDALTWVDWSQSRGVPRPITAERLHFLECHAAHLARDLETARRFHR